MSVARSLGIVALVVGGVFALFSVVLFLAPTPAVGLGIGFIGFGVPVAALGAWMAVTERPRRLERPGAGGGPRPDDGRPKSRLRQVLDGLSFFN